MMTIVQERSRRGNLKPGQVEIRIEGFTSDVESIARRLCQSGLKVEIVHETRPATRSRYLWRFIRIDLFRDES